MTLPRFHFVVPARDAELPRLRALDPDSDWRAFNDGPFAWSLQTYLRLQGSGFPVTCGNRTEPGCVNLGHAMHLRTLGPRADAFVLSLQADYRRLLWADFHIVQNREQARADAAWLPLWPQPGLVPRDTGRVGVRVVAAAGRLGLMDLDRAALRSAVASAGCVFAERDEANWNDYSGVDVLLAVRSLDRRRHPRKPPSKLINGWLAGVPVVGGWDSAFEQVGCPGEDYLRVGSPGELVAAVRALQADGALRDGLVGAGARRAAAWTVPRMVARWAALLEGQVAEVWSRQGGPGGLRRGPGWGLRAAAETAWRRFRAAGRGVRS